MSSHDHSHDHGHSHGHGHSDCCGPRLHAEGEEAVHLAEAAHVRDSWLASAMAEAEEADRASGVWEELSDKWEPGDMVQIEGLKSRADLNGRTGVLLQWNAAASRWGVAVVGTDEKVKVRHENLRRSSEEYLIKPSAEVAGASGARAPLVLAMAAGTSALAAQLAAEQYVVIDDFLDGGADGAVRELLHRLRAEGELQPGEVTLSPNPHPHPHPSPSPNPHPQPHPKPHPHPSPNLACASSRLRSAV